MYDESPYLVGDFDGNGTTDLMGFRSDNILVMVLNYDNGTTSGNIGGG